MKMKELGLLFMMLCMVFAVNAQELKKGDKLPDFHLKSAVYGDISSTELKGKVVLVSLFATWCGPCQLEPVSYTHLDVYKRQGKYPCVSIKQLD